VFNCGSCAIRQEDTIALLESKVGNHEERVIHLEKIQSSKRNLAIDPKNEDVLMDKVRE